MMRSSFWFRIENPLSILRGPSSGRGKVKKHACLEWLGWGNYGQANCALRVSCKTRRSLQVLPVLGEFQGLDLALHHNGKFGVWDFTISTQITWTIVKVFSIRGIVWISSDFRRLFFTGCMTEALAPPAADCLPAAVATYFSNSNWTWVFRAEMDLVDVATCVIALVCITSSRHRTV